MKNVILVDFHNLAFRTFFVKDVGATTVNPDFQLWKYMTFNSIYQALWKVDYVNEVIVAVDSRNTWRKLLFNRYKESRKIKRDKSEVDWNILFNVLENYIDEMRKCLPFKVLKVSRCEADDIIGVICLQGKDEYTVISNDEDYLQLSSPTVKIYNPSKKEYVKCDDTERFIVEKSLRGQSKDDIFNIKTPSDWGLTKESKGKRKPGFGPKAVEKVMKGDYKQWLKDNKLEKNFKRNRALIDFNYIPKLISNTIMEKYNNYSLPDPSNIYKFIKGNNFRGFLDEFQKTEDKLKELY